MEDLRAVLELISRASDGEWIFYKEGLKKKADELLKRFPINIQKHPNSFLTTEIEQTEYTLVACDASLVRESRSSNISGVGVAYGFKHSENISEHLPVGGSYDITYAEATAVKLALASALKLEIQYLLIISDSKNCVRTWGRLEQTASTEGFKDTLRDNIWSEIHELRKAFKKVKLVHTRSHQSTEGDPVRTLNDTADKLAEIGRQQGELELAEIEGRVRRR